MVAEWEIRPCFYFSSKITWAATWQNQQNDYAPSKDSNQPGHPPSLIRVFAVRMKKARVLSYPSSTQRRLWSDWADAQADLSVCWAHTHFVGFVMSQLAFPIFCFVCTCSLVFFCIKIKKSFIHQCNFGGKWLKCRLAGRGLLANTNPAKTQNSMHLCAFLTESLSAAVCKPRTQGFFSKEADQTTLTT